MTVFDVISMFRCKQMFCSLINNNDDSEYSEFILLLVGIFETTVPSYRIIWGVFVLLIEMYGLLLVIIIIHV